MLKSDLLELKKRYKKERNSFSRLRGCYVNANKEIVLTIDEAFQQLDDSEMYKYLDIASKVLSGTISNNLLSLEFPTSEEQPGGRQYRLMELRDSALKDDALVDEVFENIINTFNYVGNYLILLFSDAYDVINKTTDKFALDESEEVFSYILCAICPVDLSKPGLGYFERDNRIGARVQDWVVGMPIHGFMFPAFDERSSDIHSLVYYMKDPKESHPELMTELFGCEEKYTCAFKKIALQDMIRSTAANDSDAEILYQDVQSSLNAILCDQKEMYGEDADVDFSADTIRSISEYSEIPEETCEQLAARYEKAFSDESSDIVMMMDKKAIAAADQRYVTGDLARRVAELQQLLSEEQAKNRELQEALDAEQQITRELREKLGE